MKPWKVILTDAALADLDAILETTLEEFGTLQLKRYTEQIERAVRELEEAGNLLVKRPKVPTGKEKQKRKHQARGIGHNHPKLQRTR